MNITAGSPFLRAGIALLTMMILCASIWIWLRSREHGIEATYPPNSVEVISAPLFKVSASLSSAGKEFSLGSLRGTPVLVHFWATWCGPCVQELPELAKQIPKLKALGIMPVVVSEDTEWKTVKSFIAGSPGLGALEQDSFFLLDPDHKVANDFQSSQYPETYLLDRKLKIAHKFIGAQAWSHPEMYEFLAESIRAPRSP